MERVSLKSHGAPPRCGLRTEDIMTIDIRPTLEAPDDDPHLWLEEVDGADAIAWVDAQSARTLRDFEDDTFHTDRNALLSIYDSADKIPYVNRRGNYLYNCLLYTSDAADE